MRSLLRWLGLGAGQPGDRPPLPDPMAQSLLEKSLADLEAASSLFDHVTGPVAVDKAIFRLNLAQAEVDEVLHPQATKRSLMLPWLLNTPTVIRHDDPLPADDPQAAQSPPPAEPPETANDV